MSVTTVASYGADLGNQLGAVKPHVSSAAELIADKFGLSKISGWRAQGSVANSDHPKGLAIDIPASKQTGDAIAAWVTANAGPLAVKYVIWQQRIWTPTKDWTPMATRSGDRPGYDPNHLRHVHVSFTDQGAGVGVLDRLRAGVSTAVDNLTGAVGGLNPFAAWPEQATAVGIKIAGVITGLGLLVLGAHRLVAPALSSTLDKTKELIS